MLKSNIKEFTFSLIAIFLGLFLINFICGFIVKNQYIALDPITPTKAKTTFGYFLPNQEKIILFPGSKPYKVTTTALGLRTVGGDLKIKKEDIKNKYRILCLGDSFTFGLFLNDEDTYPYQLQSILKQNNKNAIVLNAGVGSSTISDSLYYFEHKGIELQPHLVTVNFYNNDLGDLLNWERSVYQKMINQSKFSLAKQIKLMNFMRIGRQWELAYRYKRSTNKIKDARVKKALLEKSTDLEDILYIAHYDKDILKDPYQESLQPLWQKYFEDLDKLHQVLKNQRVELLFIIYPDIYTVFERAPHRYQEILIKHLEEKNIPYIDLQPILKSQKENYLSLYLDLPRDYHLSKLGYGITAEEVYKHIKQFLPAL